MGSLRQWNLLLNTCYLGFFFFWRFQELNLQPSLLKDGAVPLTYGASTTTYAAMYQILGPSSSVLPTQTGCGSQGSLEESAFPKFAAWECLSRKDKGQTWCLLHVKHVLYKQATTSPHHMKLPHHELGPLSTLWWWLPRVFVRIQSAQQILYGILSLETYNTKATIVMKHVYPISECGPSLMVSPCLTGLGYMDCAHCSCHRQHWSPLVYAEIINNGSPHAMERQEGETGTTCGSYSRDKVSDRSFCSVILMF